MKTYKLRFAPSVEAPLRSQTKNLVEYADDCFETENDRIKFDAIIKKRPNQAGKYAAIETGKRKRSCIDFLEDKEENFASPVKEQEMIATSYSNLATEYEKIGNYTEALKFHEKSLAIRKKRFGELHLSTVASYDKNSIELCSLTGSITSKQLVSTSSLDSGMLTDAYSTDYQSMARHLSEESIITCGSLIDEVESSQITSPNSISEKRSNKRGKYFAMRRHECRVETLVTNLKHTTSSFNPARKWNIKTLNDSKLIQDQKKSRKDSLVKKRNKNSSAVFKKDIEYPSTAVSYRNLAMVYKSMNDMKEASGYMRTALEIQGNFLSTDRYNRNASKCKLSTMTEKVYNRRNIYLKRREERNRK